VFGTSDLAIATVLAAYMAGSPRAQRWPAVYAGRLARPVLVYGLLELGIAIARSRCRSRSAPRRSLYVALFGSQEALPDAGWPRDSALLPRLLVRDPVRPTALMGATLPLLARMRSRGRQIGSRIGTLYAVNTTGAVAGACWPRSCCCPSSGCARRSRAPRP
jgi:spermidine synthase